MVCSRSVAFPPVEISITSTQQRDNVVRSDASWNVPARDSSFNVQCFITCPQSVKTLDVTRSGLITRPTNNHIARITAAHLRYALLAIISSLLETV